MCDICLLFHLEIEGEKKMSIFLKRRQILDFLNTQVICSLRLREFRGLGLTCEKLRGERYIIPHLQGREIISHGINCLFFTSLKRVKTNNQGVGLSARAMVSK